MMKTFIRCIFTGFILPLYLFYVILKGVVSDKDRLFRSFSEFLSQFPGKIGDYMRYAFYRIVLRDIGRDCCVSYGTIFAHPTVKMGDNVYVGLYCVLGNVTIGKGVFIASRVSIPSGKYQHYEGKEGFQRIDIGENTWIGEGAIILANVGKSCIVGAGSVVVDPIADNSVVVGNPARVVKESRR